MTNPLEISAIALRARRIVETLAGTYPSRHGRFPDVLNAAADFIEHEFREIGLQVESMPYVSEEAKVRNLSVEKVGTKPEEPCIVIGAHYDTVIGTPGADDNASGVAGLLELARLLKNHPTQHTIKFVAFPHEEPPYFFTQQMGSRQYTKQLKAVGGKVLAMLALEMLGYAGENYRQLYPAPLMRTLGRYSKYGNYIALVGNLRSLPVMSVVRSAMRQKGSVGVESLSAPGFLPPLFLSDHSSFWKAGYPALMVTDTAFLRNPNYHKETDTADTLNYEFLAKVVAAVLEGVLALDENG